MTYGLARVALILDGPAERCDQPRLRTAARAWAILDRDRRMAMIDRLLAPANDERCNDLPFAR